MRQKSLLLIVLILIASSLACALGGATNDGGDPGDPTAMVEARLPTLAAQMTAYQPTLDAQLTANAPTIEAVMTLSAGEAPRSADDVAPLPETPEREGGDSTSSDGVPPTLLPDLGGFGGDIDYPTTNLDSITVGQSITATLGTTFEAHNWLFEGEAGQTVSIRVVGSGSMDPRLTLLGPDGVLISRDDDSGGGTAALLTFTVATSGEYTIRVDAWVEGEYTLSVE